MKFDTIWEIATVTFEMDGLEAMARICKLAVDTGEEGHVAEMALSAFTMAAMIAREHGNLSEESRERLEKTRKRIMGD